MTMSLVRRRIVARVALAMTAAAAIWTGVLFLHGGFDTVSLRYPYQNQRSGSADVSRIRGLADFRGGRR
jgi:hypothetical protein